MDQLTRDCQIFPIPSRTNTLHLPPQHPPGRGSSRLAQPDLHHAPDHRSSRARQPKRCKVLPNHRRAVRSISRPAAFTVPTRNFNEVNAIKLSHRDGPQRSRRKPHTPTTTTRTTGHTVTSCADRAVSVLGLLRLGRDDTHRREPADADKQRLQHDMAERLFHRGCGHGDGRRRLDGLPQGRGGRQRREALVCRVKEKKGILRARLSFYRPGLRI